MQHRAVVASFGASSGFSAAALWEWITSPSAASAVAFAGSVVSTLVGWFLAKRQEIVRARAELADKARTQAVLDALAAAVIKQAQAGDIKPGLELVSAAAAAPPHPAPLAPVLSARPS